MPPGGVRPGPPGSGAWSLSGRASTVRTTVAPLDALRAIGPQACGIAQIGPAPSDADLAELHRAEVRGVRLNPKSVGADDAQALRSLIADTARRIAPLGWHIQIYASLAMVTDVAGAIRDAPVPVVLDHMGGARAGDDDAAVRAVIELLSEGRCWVKLSGAYRVSRQGTGFEDATLAWSPTAPPG